MYGRQQYIVAAKSATQRQQQQQQQTHGNKGRGSDRKNNSNVAQHRNSARAENGRLTKKTRERSRKRSRTDAHGSETPSKMDHVGLMTTFTLVLVVLWVTSLPDVTSLSPPVLSPSFSVEFQETLSFREFLLIKNKGAMHYDFPNHQQRMDHDRGQVNNFCWNQHLSDGDSVAPCRLLFSNDSFLYVIYPEVRNCCKLCTVEQGCGPLKPDWLEGGKFFGEEHISGMDCYGWGKPGYVAAIDLWYATPNNRPCRFHEVVFPVTHNLTFVNATYREGPISEDIFAVPEYCHRKCPNSPVQPWEFALSLVPKLGVKLQDEA